MRRVFSLMALAAALTGCGGKKAEQQAILAVLKEEYKLELAFTSDRVLDVKPFAAELWKIDTSRCPKDFQVAWLDFRQTCERRASPVRFLGANVYYGVGIASVTGTDQANRLFDGMDIQESWHRLQRVCVEHGISFIAR